MGSVGAQDLYEILLYGNNIMRINLPFIRACRHLSGAARAYIPLSILRIPYTSYLST
jgi:hypothetical protein